MRVQLDGETDFVGFRAHARALLARGVAPDHVHWSTHAGNDDLFADESASIESPVGGASTYVPAAFLELCAKVVLHRDPQRFALLYHLLWRLQREPALRHDPLDAQML